MAVRGLKNNNKPKRSWFSNQEDRRGENFLEQVSDQDVWRFADQICKDIITGKVDYDKYWTHILDYNFNTRLRSVLYTKWITQAEYQLAMEQRLIQLQQAQNTPGQVVTEWQFKVSNDAYDLAATKALIYKTVYDGLTAAMQSNNINVMRPIPANFVSVLRTHKIDF